MERQETEQNKRVYDKIAVDLAYEVILSAKDAAAWQNKLHLWEWCSDVFQKKLILTNFRPRTESKLLYLPGFNSV